MLDIAVLKKLNSTPVYWILFFLFAGIALNELASNFTEPREIKISNAQAMEIGNRIWMNEGAGKSENLVVWNEGEDFPSLGIGHFIWYPQGVTHTFQESFPGLLEHIAKTQTLPLWLKELRFPPWQTRAEFLADSHGEIPTNLRKFLQQTTAEQTQYIITRLEAALPEILKQEKNPFAKRHLRENFYHVANQKNGVYALIDYVNFKGEGVSDKERYNNLGWGLAQVLAHMNGKDDNVMQDFVDAADFVLTRRVENAPRDETRWLEGWRKRLQTYL